MSIDLENLLRDTMADRARLVTEPARWDGPPARRPRAGWVAVGAVAATVVAVAGGAALLTAPADPTTGAGGDAPKACTTQAPPDWRAALTRTDPLYDGRPVFPAAQTGSGAVVGTVNRGHATDVVLTEASGGVTLLATVPAGRLVTRVDADGRWVVLSVAPAEPTDNPDSPVDRITVIDTGDGGRTEVLADAPASDTAYVQGRGAVVQNGQVYWVDAPTKHAASGTVERYDPATKQYADVGRAQGGAEVEHDIRGVGWPGGSVPAAGAPGFVPGLFRDAASGPQYHPVYSDGANVAWQDGATSTVLHWADHDGSVVSWTVDVGTLPELTAGIDAVSGPIVFFSVSDAAPQVYALDTRTGAVAQLGDGLTVAYPSFVTDGGVVLERDVDQPATHLDPSPLTRLRCG